MGFEPSRTRTCDPLVKSQLLYRLSYRPTYTRRARKGVLFSMRKVRRAFYRTLVQYSNAVIRVSLKSGYDGC